MGERNLTMGATILQIRETMFEVSDASTEGMVRILGIQIIVEL